MAHPQLAGSTRLAAVQPTCVAHPLAIRLWLRQSACSAVSLDTTTCRDGPSNRGKGEIPVTDLGLVLDTVRKRIARHQRENIGEQDTKAG